MAGISIRTSGKDQASCPVCQDLLKNPVTCNCGQSFCSACVLSPKGSRSCPRCGQMFTPKPVPRTSIKVDDLLERMQKVELPSSNHPLDPSYAGPGDVQNKLIEASPYLEENNCSQHNKLNEFYCRTDQKCICAMCALKEHKGHDTVEAETERTGKQ
ncbi:hypothetical protein M9458_057086, partial [Cirrhinus mrigala]